MATGWDSTKLADVDQAIKTLIELQGKRWICRGQSRTRNRLQPSIERDRESLSRVEMLVLERQSIDLFRSNVRFFAGEGERMALRDDLITLMVMRHHAVPTRLLDWSLSPFVAAYFACSDHDDDDGELWSFDNDRYEQKGDDQWKKWPETRHRGTGPFDAKLTMFSAIEPSDWFVCQFYPSPGFPRQDAQLGLYSLTARFHRDHNDSLANLLDGTHYQHLYIISSAIKRELKHALREKHGVWRGSLFPDTAGAADTARSIFGP